ncbi:MarR family winged helix-turn-helix transcriptional regulator [Kerstersia gyiorum]|uniref:MarR family winged helix-turn-helix transcriptional regulator n=1 Tax=Kerstersia gyiorum TaxID=206506 RepID=UPI00209DFE2A|nr:MarR family transcriptional regulator [Kerstersia gyiorum]
MGNDSVKNNSGVQDYELRILRSLRRITRAIALHSRHLESCSHITAPQLVCLRIVIEAGPLTATAISKEMHISPSTVVGILDRLEDKALIRRERGKEDRRIVFITATPAGVALARQAPLPLQQALSAGLSNLPEIERATITLSLERIVGLMEPELQGAQAAPESAAELASPLLEVPDGDTAPESGLAV